MASPSGLDPYWRHSDVISTTISPKPSPSGPLRISRVNQLDAAFLDAELDALLLAPFMDSLPTKVQAYKSEIETLLRYSLLRLCLRRNASTHGGVLQNLVLRDERPFMRAPPGLDTFVRPHAAQLEVYAACSIFPSYLLDKLRDYMLHRGFADYPQPTESALSLLLPRPPATEQDTLRRTRERKRLAWNVLQRADHLWSMMKLANFIVFLLNGVFRSPLERALHLRYIYRQRNLARWVSFEFLNRQLVWTAFTEFLLFLLPLINLRKLKVRLYRFVSKLAKMPQYIRDTFSRQAADSSSPKRDDDSNQDPEEPLGALHYLPSNICAICYSRVAMPTNLGIADAADPTDPTKLLIQQASSMPTALGSGGETVVGTATEEHEAHIPYLTNCCGAEYCYYCIVGELVQWEESSAGLDGPWQCLRCGKGVTDVKKSMQ